MSIVIRFPNVPRALEIHMGPITDVHLMAEILKMTNRWSYLRLLRTILTPEMILILEPNTETHIPEITRVATQALIRNNSRQIMRQFFKEMNLTTNFKTKDFHEK